MNEHNIDQDDVAALPVGDANRQRFGRRGILLLGTVGTAAVGLAAIATRGAFADPSPATTAATTSTTTTSGHRPPGGFLGPGAGRPGGAGLAFGPPAGGPGFGPALGGPRGGWTVTAVQGATISAKRADGTTLTITTDASTVFYVTRLGEPRAAGTLANVAVGEQIDVVGTLTGTGTVKATMVDVRPARAGGRVTAISGTTVTVSGGRATPQQIHLAAGTTYRLQTLTGSSAGSASDIQVGSGVIAEGTLNSDGSLQAQTVQIAPPSVDGVVSSVSGSTILVQRPQPRPRPNTPAGTTATATAMASSAVQTVHVTATTRYLVSTTYGPGITSAGSLSNVKSGVYVHAIGTHNSDGSLTATTVLIASAAERRRPGPAQ